MNVYINDVAGFLPNKPVDNEHMEQILGMVGNKPSRSRNIILRNNGINARYYAIDPQTGRYTHNNARLTAKAIQILITKNGITLDKIDCISCGTSSPDQLQPAHGPMVHGELGSPPCEVITTAGVCTSGITSMKYAYMSTALGLSKRSIATGSEFVSSFLRANNFELEVNANLDKLKKHPELAFEKDFIRWMLSDGAGAALISDEPNTGRISFRIDWIDNYSFAGDMPVCMYSGAIKKEDGSIKAWREADVPSDIWEQSYFSLKQDARILNKNIIPAIVERTLLPIAAKRCLKAEDITWFLPHYSSEYFRKKLYDSMTSNGFNIPYNRWFTNLSSKGNTGSASMYIILEELMYSNRLKKGDRLLCLIPESARFSICYMHRAIYMKIKEVPQEESILEGNRRACYAEDENGRYVIVPSKGWEVEKIVNSQAHENIRRVVEEARHQVLAGKVSPLKYHMLRNQMTVGMLASYTGLFCLRVYFHFKPYIFSRLNRSILKKYADAMNISIKELCELPK